MAKSAIDKNGLIFNAQQDLPFLYRFHPLKFQMQVFTVVL